MLQVNPTPSISFDLWYGTSGPQDAEIVIVGEAWGADEAVAERPFVGMSGRELDRMLAEAGIDRSKCLVTNTSAARPLNNEYWRFFIPRDSYDPNFHGQKVRGLVPNKFVYSELSRLYRQIAHCPRKLVIAVGNYALWALSDNTSASIAYEANGRPIPTDLQTWVPGGITTWRGSMIYCKPAWSLHEEDHEILLAETKLLPIIHPAAIQRQWSLRAPTVHDLKARVRFALADDWRPNPAPVFWDPPTYEQVMLKLDFWIRQVESGVKLRLACDIETHKKLLTVIGFADSINFAMAIPFITVEGGQLGNYWSQKQEAYILGRIGRLLANPNTMVEGQNFIYDTQYFQYFLGVTPTLGRDSMLMHHLLWPGTPKGLDYLSSLYCKYHWYWKDDGKEWNAQGGQEGLKRLLTYNCLDLIRTFECCEVLSGLITSLKMEAQWEETKERYYLALRMMRRGIRIDKQRRNKINFEIMQAIARIDSELNTIIKQKDVDEWLISLGKKPTGKPWHQSPKQQQGYFKDVLGMRIPKSPKTGRDTVGKDALKELERKNPEWTGLFQRMLARRSAGVFKSHFIDAGVDLDDHMRCAYNPAGTETFRWNSTANVMGGGTNLQNIPVGDED